MCNPAVGEVQVCLLYVIYIQSKYRVRNAITYNPPPCVGEVQVCPLYFIYIQCFPYHKFCDMENEYFAGGNCETRGMSSAC